jgi:tRNA threonylcarbamoyladenosine biosynthesis protein TsaB
LVVAVGELLRNAGVGLKDVGAMVAVNGPGSFTGVRVGLAAVKGLAESGSRGAGIAVVAVSRLEVLAAKAGVPSAALDAHRHEVFLRLSGVDVEAREMLAGAEELVKINWTGGTIAVGDESAAAVLGAAWPDSQLVRSAAPTAADALRLCMERVSAGKFVDLAMLDGHYLRRSDAEIFGEIAAGTRSA